MKRISSGEENIFRSPGLILKQTAISKDAKTASNCYRRLTGNSTWRLLCLSVAVEFSGKEPGPDLRAAATHISELRSLLNQSPLFAESPISDAETELGLRILQQWLFPPSNYSSYNKASLEGTLAVSHEVKKRPSTEFPSSPTKPHQVKERGETEFETAGGSRKGIERSPPDLYSQRKEKAHFIDSFHNFQAECRGRSCQIVRETLANSEQFLELNSTCI